MDRATIGTWDLGASAAESAATYAISGTAGVAGATISYTGTSSGSLTADRGGSDLRIDERHIPAHADFVGLHFFANEPIGNHSLRQHH